MIFFISCQDEKRFKLTTYIIPENSGQILTESGLYSAGTNLILEALSGDNFTFTRWSGDVDSRANPLNFEINSDLICGVPYGGIYFATIFSLLNNIPMILLRTTIKNHGTQKQIEGNYEEKQKLSAFRNKPPFTPIIPPGAANAFRELSSIIRILNCLSLTSLYSESLYINNSVYSFISGSEINGAWK